MWYLVWLTLVYMLVLIPSIIVYTPARCFGYVFCVISVAFQRGYEDAKKDWE